MINSSHIEHQPVEAAGIPIAWREPFAVDAGAYCDVRPAGESLLEMVESVPCLPAEFFDRGVICIEGHPVSRYDSQGRDLWRAIRPKVSSGERAISVTLHLPLANGGGGGGQSTAKAVGSLVAALALVVVTGGIAAGGAAGLLGQTFAAGTTAARVLAGAVGLVGALAISALTPPPAVAAASGATPVGTVQSTNTDQPQAAAASGNALTPGGAIPRVVGTRKVFPPFAGEPIVELVGNDEKVEAAFILNGPHAWSDTRVDGVTIDDAADIEYETFEGWQTDGDMTLCVRQGRTITPQITLSTHKVDPDSQDLLLDPADPESDLPVWHAVASRSSPDEIWLHLLLSNGLSINGSTSTDVVVPLRIQVRKKGAVSWTNFPEIHLSDSTLQLRRRAIILKFEAPPATIDDVIPPQKSGFIYANINVPGQSVDPATTGWDADSYFIGASGNDYLHAGNVGGSKVRNIALYENRIEVYLDPATFDPGIYEVQIKRGAAFLASSFTKSSYSYSGSVKDFFTYASTSSPAIPMARSNLADSIQLIRCISIWNEYPVLQKGFALLAIRASNRQVQNVSAICSGYVKDWDGSGWNTWTTTSNPAAHYADILCGSLNLDPLSVDLRDDAGLVAWRTLCATNGWKCDAIIDDFRTQDALSLLASCGYAKPYQSEIYGVTIDKDRSADSPIQVFSRRNAVNVKYEKAFARLPQGFIVNYVNKDDDYNNAQTVIYQRDISQVVPGLLETVTYEGLVETGAVDARGLFDLDQGDQRATIYTLDADIESIVCRRGDLVGLQHDIITSRCGDGLIKSKTVEGGFITGLVLDATIPITNVDDLHDTLDMHAISDMHDVGVTTAIAIRHHDGAGTLTVHPLANDTGETDTLMLATPYADTAGIAALEDNEWAAGSLAVAGTLGVEYLRLIVSKIAPSAELQATVTLVDEAPLLERYAA